MRAMTLDDVDDVLAIEQEVQTYPWTRGNFVDALIHGYVCRVHEIDGEIRGYAVLRPTLDEAELLSIGVSALHQRKGLGREILHEMFDRARELDIRRVFLEVSFSNATAIALYRNAGFAEIGVRRGYYQNANGSEDAITMACNLVDEVNG
ncbi:MAG TPA: ribosomal protein S18-alanine N-acetyltransferase [Gallionella sp.]|nr:ribosomal protein S18-alanine N-acetyltransferase [Gallionella sp.]